MPGPFEALVRGHSTDLYRYAYWLCGQEALAQDPREDTCALGVRLIACAIPRSRPG